MINQNLCNIIDIQKRHMDKLIEEADGNRVYLMGLIDTYGEAWDEFKKKYKNDSYLYGWNYGMEVRCSAYAFAKARRYIHDTKEFIDFQINGELK